MAKASDKLKDNGVTQALRPASFKIEAVTRHERYLKLLIYGNFGVGKTYLAATAVEVPQMQDVLLVNAEAGDLTLDEFEGLEQAKVLDYKTLSNINKYLRSHCKARDDDDEDRLCDLQEQVTGARPDRGEAKRYKTVIVDTLSEVEQYCMNQLLGVTDTTQLHEETQSAEWSEYKKNHTMILRMVRAFRDLPMNVIFTCAEQYVQDESKKMKFSPNLTGKLAKSVQGFMDMVGYLVVGVMDERGNIPRKLYVVPSGQGKYDAKHRYTNFKKDHFFNPTIENILKETGLLSKEGATLR